MTDPPLATRNASRAAAVEISGASASSGQAFEVIRVIRRLPGGLDVATPPSRQRLLWRYSSSHAFDTRCNALDVHNTDRTVLRCAVLLPLF